MITKEKTITKLEQYKRFATRPEYYQSAIDFIKELSRSQEKLDEHYNGDISVEDFIDFYIEVMNSKEQVQKARILTNEDADAYDEWKISISNQQNGKNILTGKCDGCTNCETKKTFQKECLGCKREWWPEVNGDHYERLPDNYNPIL